jgi:hypothetical protein
MTTVETESEAYVSTDNLFQFVVGDAFMANCGAFASSVMSEWLRNSFFSVQHQLLFYHRVRMRSFDEYCNSLCEAENSAAKTTNTGTKATQAINTSANALDHRSDLRMRYLNSRNERKKQTTPVYSATDAGNYVTAYAEQNAQLQCKAWSSGKDKYWLWKKDSKTMWVLLKKHKPSTSPGAASALLRCCFVILIVILY